MFDATYMSDENKRIHSHNSYSKNLNSAMTYTLYPKNKIKSKQNIFEEGNLPEKENFKSLLNEIRKVHSLSKNIADYLEGKNINSIVSRFLLDNKYGELEHSVIADHDSDFYTVEIHSEDLSVDELFILAKTLNRRAVLEDLGFVVIAGV